jgi:hypothetical protein
MRRADAPDLLGLGEDMLQRIVTFTCEWPDWVACKLTCHALRRAVDTCLSSRARFAVLKGALRPSPGFETELLNDLERVRPATPCELARSWGEHLGSSLDLLAALDRLEWARDTPDRWRHMDWLDKEICTAFPHSLESKAVAQQTFLFIDAYQAIEKLRRDLIIARLDEPPTSCQLGCCHFRFGGSLFSAQLTARARPRRARGAVDGLRCCPQLSLSIRPCNDTEEIASATYASGDPVHFSRHTTLSHTVRFSADILLGEAGTVFPPVPLRGELDARSALCSPRASNPLHCDLAELLYVAGPRGARNLRLELRVEHLGFGIRA